jgi:hypothetical protein
MHFFNVSCRWDMCTKTRSNRAKTVLTRGTSREGPVFAAIKWTPIEAYLTSFLAKNAAAMGGIPFGLSPNGAGKIEIVDHRIA